ncbi:MAG: leucine-rich repeat domain-containing protein [Chitinophagales bacterium]
MNYHNRPNNAIAIIRKEQRKKTNILNLQKCSLTKWPEEIFKMEWLQVLMLGQNASWNIERQRFTPSSSSNFTNKLKIIPKGILKLKNLIVLDISGNNISKIEHLDSLEQLETLNIKGNKISEIDNLGSLTQLQELYLNDNQITKIENLRDLTLLQKLYLNNRPVTY